MGKLASYELRKIKLGSPAAERDESLQDYFIKSDAFRRVAEGEKRILIGNRGAGKSAIFQYIAKREGARPDTAVIELTPEDYSYELLRDTMAAEKDGSWHKQSAYAAAWKYHLYVMVMKEIAKSGSKLGRKTPQDRIARYVRDNHKGGQHDKLSVLISYLKRLEGVKVGKYEGGMKVRELERLYRLEDISSLIPDVKSVLERKRIIILVDELDRGWDESEDAKAFVAGLFQASQSINGVSSNMKLYMSLRQELYDNIPALTDDAQKLRDIIEVIRWDEEGLKRLVSSRIRVALNRREVSGVDGSFIGVPDSAVWSTLFAQTLAYRGSDSFNYMIDRTLYRPREIIQFCSQAIEQATESSATTPLDYGTIAAAERIYSEGRAQDIASEYKFQYPELLAVFEEFRGLTYAFERKELEELCTNIIVRDRAEGSPLSWLDSLEPEGLIEILWKVDFMKAYSIGGIKGQARSGSIYLGKYQASSINIPSITRFQVHPMFRPWLSMKEPKKSK